MNEDFSTQLDVVIRANRLETVQDEMLRTAATLLRGFTGRGRYRHIEAWLRDYEIYATAPEDTEFIWTTETDPRWALMEQPTMAFACRGSQTCREVVVAKVNKMTDPLRPPQWWRYCAGHLLGRRVHDGTLQVRTLVKKGSTL